MEGKDARMKNETEGKIREGKGRETEKCLASLGRKGREGGREVQEEDRVEERDRLG